LQKIPM
ncbi:unnamed protein product, partial [Allacma fusca]